MHMAAGLSVGLAGLAAGYAIGIVGDVVRFGTAITYGLAQECGLTGLGRACIHEPVEDLRRHGPHPHFRRSPGAVWVGIRRSTP